jgi:hypothetical protein
MRLVRHDRAAAVSCGRTLASGGSDGGRAGLGGAGAIPLADAPRGESDGDRGPAVDQELDGDEQTDGPDRGNRRSWSGSWWSLRLRNFDQRQDAKLVPPSSRILLRCAGDAGASGVWRRVKCARRCRGEPCRAVRPLSAFSPPRSCRQGERANPAAGQMRRIWCITAGRRRRRAKARDSRWRQSALHGGYSRRTLGSAAL